MSNYMDDFMKSSNASKAYKRASVEGMDFISDYMPIDTKETKSFDTDKLNEVVFNPFQRGSGCTLAGYTLQEILAHTR